jgi:hypothetical protein
LKVRVLVWWCCDDEDVEEDVEETEDEKDDMVDPEDMGAMDVGADFAIFIAAGDDDDDGAAVEEGGAIVIGTIPLSPNPPEDILIIPVPLDRFPITPIVDPPDDRKDFDLVPRPLSVSLVVAVIVVGGAVDPLPAVLPLRFRFLITSVFKLSGRTTPCSFKNNPQALHRGLPLESRRQRGVVPVPQFVQAVVEVAVAVVTVFVGIAVVFFLSGFVVVVSSALFTTDEHEEVSFSPAVSTNKDAIQY